MSASAEMEGRERELEETKSGLADLAAAGGAVLRHRMRSLDPDGCHGEAEGKQDTMWGRQCRYEVRPHKNFDAPSITAPDKMRLPSRKRPSR